jgi:rubrerythrin
MTNPPMPPSEETAPDTGSEAAASGQVTLAELIETAMAYQQATRSRYRRLQDSVSPESADLVALLVEEEQHHYEMLADMLQRHGMDELLQQPRPVPATFETFIGFTTPDDVERPPDEEQSLQHAVQCEQAAMDHYRTISESLPPGKARDLFRYLCAEQTLHHAELRKRLVRMRRQRSG